MSLHSDQGKVSVEAFAQQMRSQMIPLSNRFSYFFTALPMTEDDVKEYLEEPVAALPPGLASSLPAASVFLVPYLERAGNRTAQTHKSGALVSFEKPDEKSQIWSAKLVTDDEAVLVLAVKDLEVADYHYRFYHLVAEIASELCPDRPLEEFRTLLREELNGGVHGEVDDQSWQLKQALLRRQGRVGRRTKGFERYARQALADTLTLYLHGICCDIDVDTGPRQIASRHLRRRLELLHSMFPPPEGYVVFPEELNHADERRK
ncbi:MAG: hypothetical protein KIT09_03945 [Bryobacteraceae bacterium]|nr:hypothetical protein [Bryobacteraceae bacterium]